MWGIDMVFVVGGNGGNAGANAIQQECEKQNVVASIVGIPKSIDNDILLVRVVPPNLDYWHSVQYCGADRKRLAGRAAGVQRYISNCTFSWQVAAPALQLAGLEQSAGTNA